MFTRNKPRTAQSLAQKIGSSMQGVITEICQKIICLYRRIPRRGTFGVSESFCYRKSLCIREYHGLSSIFFVSVPKKFIGGPSRVFENLPVNCACLWLLACCKIRCLKKGGNFLSEKKSSSRVGFFYENTWLGMDGNSLYGKSTFFV